MELSMEQLCRQDLQDPEIGSINVMKLLPGDVIYASVNDETPSVRLALVNETLEITVYGEIILRLTRPVKALPSDVQKGNKSFCMGIF